MIKRIPCRIISSVPLGRITDVSHRCDSSNDKPDRSGDFVDGNVRVNHTSNSANRTGWLNIAKVPVDDGLTGYILDCYA